jgi:hypothetical protein
VENQIRPIAIGRSNWLFAGSPHVGQRAARLASLSDPQIVIALDTLRAMEHKRMSMHAQDFQRLRQLLRDALATDAS